MERLTIITDTWPGMTNGVSTVIAHTKKVLEARGMEVFVIHPGLFFSVALPIYPEIRFAFPKWKIEKLIKKQNPDYIHIVTEGPLGLAARMACSKNEWSYTSAYHTRFPEYIHARFKFSFAKSFTYFYLRWFHSKSEHVVVSNTSLRKELEDKGFKNMVVVPLGVDTELFKKNPQAKNPTTLKSPVFVYLGRVAIEKNVRAFLECDLPGSKMVIGDGPKRKELAAEFSGRAHFCGYKKGQELVDLLSASDVFVFPSKTDTFGLTIIEALACGLPVAAYDVQSPRDIIKHGADGFIGENLQENAIKCLELDSSICRNKAMRFSWNNFGNEFAKHLVSVNLQKRVAKNPINSESFYK